MRVETVKSAGDNRWTLALSALIRAVRSVTLTRADLDSLKILDSAFTYDGDGRLLRLSLQLFSSA